MNNDWNPKESVACNHEMCEFRIDRYIIYLIIIIIWPLALLSRSLTINYSCPLGAMCLKHRCFFFVLREICKHVFVVSSQFNSEMQAMFCARILSSLYSFPCGSDVCLTDSIRLQICSSVLGNVFYISLYIKWTCSVSRLLFCALRCGAISKSSSSSTSFNPFTPELKKCILPTFQKAIVWVM